MSDKPGSSGASGPALLPPGRRPWLPYSCSRRRWTFTTTTWQRTKESWPFTILTTSMSSSRVSCLLISHSFSWSRMLLHVQFWDEKEIDTWRRSLMRIMLSDYWLSVLLIMKIAWRHFLAKHCKFEKLLWRNVMIFWGINSPKIVERTFFCFVWHTYSLDPCKLRKFKQRLYVRLAACSSLHLSVESTLIKYYEQKKVKHTVIS